MTSCCGLRISISKWSVFCIQVDNWHNQCFGMASCFQMHCERTLGVRFLTITSLIFLFALKNSITLTYNSVLEFDPLEVSHWPWWEWNSHCSECHLFQPFPIWKSIQGTLSCSHMAKGWGNFCRHQRYWGSREMYIHIRKSLLFWQASEISINCLQGRWVVQVIHITKDIRFWDLCLSCICCMLSVILAFVNIIIHSVIAVRGICIGVDIGGGWRFRHLWQ